jgi:hypothetical protein
MPTKRTWRERQVVASLTAYQISELMTGEITYPVRNYTGYGDGYGEDLHAFIDDRMRADWAVHGDELLEIWISGSDEWPNELPWLFFYGAPGTRPWAFWALGKHPPINADEYEHEHRYLDRVDLWLPGERAMFEAAGRNAA